jgi:hypothetical protein
MHANYCDMQLTNRIFTWRGDENLLFSCDITVLNFPLRSLARLTMAMLLLSPILPALILVL